MLQGYRKVRFDNCGILVGMDSIMTGTLREWLSRETISFVILLLPTLVQ